MVGNMIGTESGIIIKFHIDLLFHYICLMCDRL